MKAKGVSIFDFLEAVNCGALRGSHSRYPGSYSKMSADKSALKSNARHGLGDTDHD